MIYEYGAVRWKRWTRDADIRSYRPPKNWVATAHLLDYHPCTGKTAKKSRWWIREKYIGGVT